VTTVASSGAAIAVGVCAAALLAITKAATSNRVGTGFANKAMTACSEFAAKRSKQMDLAENSRDAPLFEDKPSAALLFGGEVEAFPGICDLIL
jgi:hypothetical protein